MMFVAVQTRWRPNFWARETIAVPQLAHLGPVEDDSDEDWDTWEPDLSQDEFWEPDPLDDDDEPDPEQGDFWQDSDDIEDHAGALRDPLR